MTVKNWSDLYSTGDPSQLGMGWGKVSFYSSPGGQTSYDLSSVNTDEINGITARGQKHGRTDYVTKLGKTNIEYFAPPDAKLKLNGNEITFSPASMKGGPVTFEISEDSEQKINGARVQSSGYFRLRLDDPNELLGAPFTAIDLIPGVNTVSTDDGNVYPPGAYIFHLDGSGGIGFDMQDRYSTATIDPQGNEIFLTQPPGVPMIQIELLETPEPPIYLVWYDNDGNVVAVVNSENPYEPHDPVTDGLEPQELITAERLRVILSNIFAAADVDPTGEGTVYLPWKVEQWTVPAVSRNNYDLRKAAVEAVNAAPRTTKNGIENYAGQIIPAPDNKAAALDCYADSSIKFTLEDSANAEGGKQLKIKSDPANPVDRLFRLLPATTAGGFRDIEIQSSGYFQIIFHPPNEIDEDLRQKIVDAQEANRSTTLVLIDGDNMDDANSIYPPGRYIFRPYDPAGATFVLLSKATISGKDLPSPANAYLAINMIRQTGGDEFYNVWYNPSGPAKIINDTDPLDMRSDLKGMKQVKPVLLKDVGTLVGNVQRQLTVINKDLKALTDKVNEMQPGGVWKIEQWIDEQKNLYYAVYSDDGKTINVFSATDPTKRLPNTAGLSKVPTLIEKELENNPDDTPAAIIDNMQAAIDEMERHAGFENLGEQKGTLDIDWTKGKLRKLVLLSGNLTINLTNPPAYPTMLDLFVAQSPNNGGTEYQIDKFTSANAPLTESKKGLKPETNEARHIQFFYDGKKYYVDSNDF